MISVIVPTLNEEKYIEPTLKALKNQIYRRKFEVIVADSLSRDKTVEIAEKYADKVISVKKRTVGEVAYVYDSGSGTLTRIQKDFSQIYSKEEGTLTQSLANIESLRFQYYFYDKQNKSYLWLDEWSKKGIPLAVRLELGFNNGKETDSFTKTVSIPVSG